MGNSHAYDHFRTKVKPALASKLSEFSLLGFDSITESSLWGFLQKKKWKKVKDDMQLHEVIQDILGVRVSDYMSYATIEAYKAPKFSFEDENDWKELLK